MLDRTEYAVQVFCSKHGVRSERRRQVPPMDRYLRSRLGIRMGRLEDALTPDQQERVMAAAARMGCTVAEAVAELLG
jgi:hypothetical protein